MVGTVVDPIEVLVAVGDTEADVAVVTLPDSGAMPGMCSHLFYAYPQLLILARSSARTRACVYRQAITVEPLADLSDEGMRTAVRRVHVDRTGCGGCVSTMRVVGPMTPEHLCHWAREA